MATGNRLFIFYITDGGRKMSERLVGFMPSAEAFKYDSESFASKWQDAQACVFVMASGIAVRAIAPLLEDKKSDPAVVVMDEKGANVVSLLSGHEGGANKLTEDIARFIKGNSVVSTSTDVNELTSIDVFAADNTLGIENRKLLAATSAKHIRDGSLSIFSDIEITLPSDYKQVDKSQDADVVITSKIIETKALLLRPKSLVLGLGINSGTEVTEIRQAIDTFLAEKGYAFESISTIATHIKKCSEKGLRAFAKEVGLRLTGLNADELNSVEGIEESAAPMKALGVQGVSEPAAVFATGGGELLVNKVKTGNLTLALAQRRKLNNILYVVGTGPGGYEYMSPRAMRALRECDAVVGYKTYLRQIESLIEDKETVASAMTEEVKRARAAVDAALAGKKVAMISGGDPGVYAMAGLVYEVVRSMDADLQVEVIPGISALNACASRLGAPLMHDFCAISLSDRLTPWELIVERLEAAAKADFVIALYNPKSKGRAEHINKARDIFLKHRSPDTPVGIVQAATRDNEDVAVTTLDWMLEFDINMQSTVIIGNSNSFTWRGNLITPRGYSKKYEL